MKMNSTTALLTIGVLVLLALIPAGSASPVVTYYTPHEGQNNANVTVYFTGIGFLSDCTAYLSRTGYADIHPVSISLSNQTEESAQLLIGTYNLVGAAPGLWDVVVLNTDGSSLVIPDGFTITGPPPPAPGSISVNSVPTGALIFLDGVSTGQTTNSLLTGIAPGTHSVLLNLTGYYNASQQVTVNSGQTAIVSFTLVPIPPPPPATGSISVNSNPSGALIILDGASTGQTTNSLLTLIQPGTHTVLVNLSGYYNASQQVTVTAGQTTQVFFSLVPIPPPVPTKGNISITSSPAGALVYLDGASTGQTTYTLLPNIDPGSHSVLLTLAGYQNFTTQVIVVAGQTTQIYASLVPIQPPIPTTGNISISSSPTGALVFLDSVNTGQNTNTVLQNINPGSHSVRLNLSGYQDGNAQVTVTAGQTAQVYIALIPAPGPVPTTGNLSVMSSPTGALISIDGSTTGQVTNAVITGIAPGSHAVSLTLTGYQPFNGQVIITAGQTAQLYASLVPIQPPVPTKGNISVSSNPAGASVYLDGVFTGQATNTLLLNIDPGSHAVMLTLPGYQNVTTQVMVTAGQTAQVFVSFIPVPPSTGNISVSSDPTGAAIYLDGSSTGFVTNALLTGINPGSHTVRLSLAGYQDVSTQITVTAGQTVLVFVSLAPNPTTGIIQVSSGPTGAMIFLDGNNTGQVTNAALNGIVPGIHSVALVLNGYQNFSTQVTVAAGQTVPIYAGLVPVSPPVPTMGNISVNSYPSGALIYLDGVNTGQTTNSVLYNVAAGSHTVLLNLTGYQNGTAQVLVIAGQTAQVYATLLPVTPPVPTKGSISVYSSPTGALVYLDGVNTGQTTNTLLTNIAPGSHTVLLNLTGYKNNTVQVMVIAGQTAQVFATLTPVKPPVPTDGAINVNSNPLGAEIFLDGIDTGEETISVLSGVQAGSHSVLLNLTGYKNGTAQVAVVAGQTAQVYISLTPLPPPVPTNGSISVNSDPTGAEIFLDGMDTGEDTNFVLNEIPPGVHSVLLNLTGYQNSTVPVTVIKGQTAQVFVTLVPIPPPGPTTGNISVNSNPMGAAIYLDGAPTGQMTNSILYNLEPGDYSILLTLNGYQNFTGQVTVIKGQTAQFYANLVPTPPAPPVANFNADPTSGAAPLMVQFTDESTGVVTGWAWDFNNDGHIDSTIQNPSHTYQDPGTYSVNLTVTGPGGRDSKVLDEYISVSPSQPVADFTADPISGDAPLMVQFTDASTGDITGWAWDFNNDGHIDSTLENPTYTYVSPGTFSVNLTVTGPGGKDSKVKDEFISVSPSAPVANFNADPTSGAAPLMVQFTDASTGDITGWAWDFNNDGHIDSTLENPTYTYQYPGTYSVNLTVTGPGGKDSRVKDEFISVSPSHPVADFNADPTSGPAPLTVQFTDESIGNITAWAWDFNNDGHIDSTARNPTYTYQNSGTYSVNLTVTGPGGSDSEIKDEFISVSPTHPVASFVANVTAGYAPLTVQFTDQSTGTITAWAWDFNNDGHIDSTVKNPQYTYQNAGTYSVNLTVTGPGGVSSKLRLDYIHVNATPEGAFIGNPTSGMVPLRVQFTEISTGNPWLRYWSFGDASTIVTGKDPAHVYMMAGDFTVTLTTLGPDGTKTYTREHYIHVDPNPNYTPPLQLFVPIPWTF
jgi:PKD repeat protein